MKRKVCQVGPATLCISLPSKWAKANDIKKGDEMEVVEEEGRLIVGGGWEKIDKIKEITINVPTSEIYTRRLINIPYIEGYDSLKIIFTDKAVLELIQKHIQNLLGFEIIEQGSTFCVVKNVAEGIEKEFDNTFQRMFSLTISMGEELYESLNKKDFKTLDNVKELELFSNKLNKFCKRMLNKKSHGHPSKSHSIYVIVGYLEGIGDMYKEVCKLVSEKKKVLNRQTLLFLQELNELLKLFRKLFYHFNESELLNFKKKEMNLKKKEHFLFAKSKKGEQLILSKLIIILNYLHHMSEELHR